MKKVTTSKSSISINSCPELNKTHFFPVSIVKYVNKKKKTNKEFGKICDWFVSKTEI